MEKKTCCKLCRKNIFPRLENITDWFMVNNSMWREFCHEEGIGNDSIVCTDCFEKSLGREISLSDLKLKNDNQELSINYWILSKQLEKDPHSVVNRIPFLINRKNYLIKSGFTEESNPIVYINEILSEIMGK